jgi:hypothetical protein
LERHTQGGKAWRQVSRLTAGVELDVVRTGLEGKVGTAVLCKAVMSMCTTLGVVLHSPR